MYINRMLVLGFALAMVTFPMFKGWLTSEPTAWLRYYALWALVIAFTWWSNRSRHTDEL